MDGFQVLFLAVGLPILTLGLHEITHLVVARTVSPVSVELASYVPFRLRLDFHQTPPRYKLRIVVLAPLLVGILVAIIAIQSGFWQELQSANPYYLYYLVGLNWLLYIALSPADLRLALRPPTEDNNTTAFRPIQDE